MIGYIFTIVILALSIPIGFWIAWLSRDELSAGRKWFVATLVGGAVLALIAGALRQAAAAYTGVFIAVLAGIAYRKSHDRKWLKTTRA
jgi:hypothetical protein